MPVTTAPAPLDIFDDDNNGWQDMPVVQEDELKGGLDEEDQKQYHYVPSTKGTNAANAIGTIDVDDLGNKWRSKIDHKKANTRGYGQGRRTRMTMCTYGPGSVFLLNIQELFFFFWVIKDFIDYSNQNSLPLDVLQLWIDGKEDEEKGIIPLPDVAVADAAEGTVFPLTKSMAHLTRGDSGRTQTPIFPSASAVPSLYCALKKGETELDICPTADRIISRPQPEEVELEEKELHQKQSVTTTNASQALQDSGKLSNKKGSKKRKVDNDNNGEQSSKQKAPPQKKSKTVAPPKKKKKKKEEEINRIDAYVIDFGDSKLGKRKAVTLPAPPPVPKCPKISPEPSRSLNAASSAYIHAIEPIFTFIKRSDSPFEGVGVYSCAIILHNSGIPPLTRTEEVLNCPARLARLIESYFNFISFMKSKKDADYILRHSRKRHRLTINATEKEKLEYHGSLSVYGKEKCYVSQRHAHLIKLFNSVHESASTPFSSSGVDFYDPFEPAYIENTLSLPGHLGHLIFGIETWKKMCPSSGIEEEVGKDPLSQYFDVLAKKKVKLLESKYLDLECYRDTLQVLTKKCCVMPYVYKYNSVHKQL
ncbi:hypothetical protein IW261DRAFT_1625966 [Armillaria novae-zelandiae]|uniref:Uncharacterized protein n=1 Tax=Armillaria novae-zelandiae TaxID=153914 RepID=A0AA39NCW4_9AGAR|nr:hypothetical protein IW261DRAFT_1625966 [Armillaria novae-zelandiae]